MTNPNEDTLSETMGRAAQPHVVTFRGKPFQVRLIDQDAKTAWERWLKRNAYKEALESTGDADMAARTTTQMAMLQHFKWGSAFSRQMLASEGGGYAFAAYLMRCEEAEVRAIAGDAAAGPELKAALDAVVMESFPPAPAGGDKPDAGPPNPTSAAPA